MKKGARILRICLRAVIVALLVCTALNLINQGDALLASEPIDAWRAALTYLVPFLVSTHGAPTASR